jgi:hypothetical protein
MTFNIQFFVWSFLLLSTEILIALFGKGFLRHFVGDFLVVVLIYCFIRIFFKAKNDFKLISSIFIFSISIELLQILKLPKVLHVKSPVMETILGSTFDWLDLLAYFLGCLLILLINCYLNDYKKSHN